MKKSFLLSMLAVFLFGFAAKAQDDKSKRPSPPAKATETISGGAVITIDYSSPSLKNRVIGKDVEPMKGQVWRAGANEATVFETSKKIMVEGKPLAAGKYGFYVLQQDDGWNIIFNKVTDHWGADGYDAKDDALRVKIKAAKAVKAMEKLTYTITKDGKISLVWGDLDLTFHVK